MPRKYPSYRYHEGRAVVQWAPFFGPGKQHYLSGPYGSPESHEEFAAIKRRIDELRAAGKSRASMPSMPRTRKYVGDLISAYRDYAKANSKPAQWHKIRAALRVVNELHGDLHVKAFDSSCLHEVRDAMVGKGWARSYVNQEVNLVKGMFAWGVERGLVPPHVHAAVAVVKNLKEGQTIAPDRPPIEPVDWENVAAVLPYLSQTVADMVRVHYFTGMRSDEVCGLRVSELDTSRAVWIYHKRRHKTKRFGKQKVVCIGPRAQAVLAPYLATAADYLFSPAKSVAENVARRKAEATTIVYGKAKMRQPKPRDGLNERFTSRTYQKAIVHGFLRYAKALGKGECPCRVKESKTPKRSRDSKRKIPVKPAEWLRSLGIGYWHPHQLRHARATLTEAEFGIEGAMAQLGNTLTAAQIYAKQTLDRAMNVAQETG